MNLKMKYIILYVEKFEECLRFYKDVLQLPIKVEHGTYIEFNTGTTILAMNTRQDVKELTDYHLQKVSYNLPILNWDSLLKMYKKRLSNLENKVLRF